MIAKYLFVYGWLKSKYKNRRNFELPSIQVKKATILGSLYQVAEYPGLVLDQQYEVLGEAILVPTDFDWEIVDSYEHASPLILHNPEYKRVTSYCRIEDQEVQCWVYEYAREVLPETRVQSGDF
jgi:gamma-glutamylcyclotransferase (GGCT)/AIG2-like uncharacterized protein YtfP